MANSLCPNSDLESLRWRLQAYESSIARSKRKRFGQFFTGPRASSLLAALCVQGGERTIVDPMAGHGDLLEAVAARSTRVGQRVSLTGVEIDAPTAELGAERLQLCSAAGGHRAEIIHADAFTPELWSRERSVSTFDLVVANPPYVRYQEHSGKQSKRVRFALHALAQMLENDAESDAWMAMIDGYSGLADLSVPSWMLCSLLVKPGGILALVVPRTWMSRDYATVIRYLQMRFFEPMFIVEEHGVGWFEDALVPATLVVSRRLPAKVATIPLCDRSGSDSTLTIASIQSTAADNRSLVGRAFPDANPDEAFVNALRAQTVDASDQIAVRFVPWAQQRDEVLTRCGRDKWTRRVGERSKHGTKHTHPAPSVPPAITGIIGESSCAFATLEDLGYQVGQGLRTGCNQFFYVASLGPGRDGLELVRTHDEIGGDSIEIPCMLALPVVRRQSDAPGFAVDQTTLDGRVLALHGWSLPEDVQVSELNCVPDSLASFIRRAAHTKIGPAHRRTPIPGLSAVRTNTRQRTASRSLFPSVTAPRFWYTLPAFSARHRPAIFVARVNSGSPSFILNTTPPTLVDANFSSIYGHSESIPLLAMLALLNSTWCKACAECIGTPMGGGALKLEATQLRYLPIPVLSSSAIARLVAIGRILSGLTASRPSEYEAIVDDVILNEIVAGDGEATSIRQQMLSLIEHLRAQRTRVRRKAQI